MLWEERIENYARETGFPKSLFVDPDGRVVGTWIMGNDYRVKSAYYGGYPAGYLRVDWWDRAEGPLPNPDVKYPAFAKAAAYACSAQACSSPVFDPQKLDAMVKRLRQAAAHEAG